VSIAFAPQCGVQMQLSAHGSAGRNLTKAKEVSLRMAMYLLSVLHKTSACVNAITAGNNLRSCARHHVIKTAINPSAKNGFPNIKLLPAKPITG